MITKTQGLTQVLALRGDNIPYVLLVLECVQSTCIYQEFIKGYNPWYAHRYMKTILGPWDVLEINKHCVNMTEYFPRSYEDGPWRGAGSGEAGSCNGSHMLTPFPDRDAPSVRWTSGCNARTWWRWPRGRGGLLARLALPWTMASKLLDDTTHQIGGSHERVEWLVPGRKSRVELVLFFFFVAEFFSIYSYSIMAV